MLRALTRGGKCWQVIEKAMDGFFNNLLESRRTKYVFVRTSQVNAP